MTNTLIVVFLMDAVTEFAFDFNKTRPLIRNNINFNLPKIKEECDLNVTKAIIKTVKERFHIDLLPSNKIDAVSSDELINDNNFNSLMAESETYGMENIEFTDDNNLLDSGHAKDIKSKEHILNDTNLEVKAPFLVAIFETLSNVTAQTCAGTLLSPHWVLTAASCVDVLGYLRNTTNTTNGSHYTIIAQTSNPFIDGSVHNVTEVLLHPVDKHVGSTKGHNSPRLAMMQIEPGVATAGLEVAKDELEGEAEARVYGWIYVKNGSNPDSMKSMSIPVKITTEDKCKFNSTGGESLCVITNEEDSKYSSQLLSSGGPVVVVEGGRPRVVALARSDDGAGALLPVARHSLWVRQLLKYVYPYKISCLSHLITFKHHSLLVYRRS